MHVVKELLNNVIPAMNNVIPAKAGIHKSLILLDPRFRGDDGARG